MPELGELKGEGGEGGGGAGGRQVADVAAGGVSLAYCVFESPRPFSFFVVVVCTSFFILRGGEEGLFSDIREECNFFQFLYVTEYKDTQYLFAG